MGLFNLLFGGVKIDRTIEVNKASATAGLKIIYGRRKVEPVSVYKCVSRDNMPVSGVYDHADLPVAVKYDEHRKNYDWLYRVDVWGLGEISAIEKIWVEGEYSQSDRYRKRPYFRAHSMFGGKNQTAITEFAAVSGSKWSAAHRGREISYSINRFYNSKKKPQFRSEPKVEALIKGIAVYDPRDVSQNIQDQSTWKYSDNKVLVALNYLMASYGQGVKASEIDFDSWKAAADICDQTVISIPDVLVNDTGNNYANYLDRNSGQFVDVGINQRWPNYRVEQAVGQTTMQRYESHVAIDPKNATVENMRQLLDGFGWSMPWSNGQYKLIVEEAVVQSVASFDENDIIGGWKIFFSSRKNRLNRMTIEFANRHKNFEQDVATWPQAQSDIHLNFLNEDQGEDLHSRETVSSISDHYQAQAYAEYLVRKSRVNMRIKGLKLGPRAITLDPGDVIDLTDYERGFDKKYFIVESVTFGEDLIPSVTLIEYDPAVYGAEVSQEPNNLPAQEVRVWDDPAPIDGLIAIPFHDKNGDGTTINGFDLQWQSPENTAGLDYIDISWRVYNAQNIGLDEEDQTPFTESFQVPIDSHTSRIKGLKDNENYDIRLSYKTVLGQISDSTVISSELGDAATDIITNYENIIGAPTTIDELDPDAGQDINATNLGPVVSREGLRWGFRHGTSQGWMALNGSFTAGPQSIYLENTTNPDVGMRSPILSFSGADNMAVRVRIRAVGQDIAANPTLYYKTTTHNESASYRKEYGTITFKAGKWRGLIFDMRDLTAGGDDWLNSIITQIRLDPAQKTGVKFQIDGIVIGYFGSADVTSENTAADTALVNGVSADIVESRAETGYRLTTDDPNFKLDSSSIDGVEIATALSGGINISTIKNWGFSGYNLTQAGTTTKVHKDSLYDVDIADAKIGISTKLAVVKDHASKGYGLTVNDPAAKLHTSSIDGVEIATALSDGVNISAIKNWGFTGFDLTQAGTVTKIHRDSLQEVDLSDAKIGTVTKLAAVKIDAEKGRELTEDNPTQLDPSSIAGLDVVLGQTQLAGDLRLTATGDASAASTTHAFQIGYSTDFNLIADVNEIMARRNGAVAPLYLNNDGGTVYIGNNVLGRFSYAAGHAVIGPQNTTAEGGQLTLEGADTYNDLYIDNNQGNFRVIRDGLERLNVGFNAGRTRIRSDYGHVDIGPQNTAYCHFNTDRSKYYFNQPVYALSGVYIYNTNSYLSTNTMRAGNMRLGNLELKYYGGWANEPETDILRGGYLAGIGDYMLMRTAGNNVAGERDAIIIADGVGFAYGKGANATGGPDTTVANEPVEETLFRVDRTGQLYLNGKIVFNQTTDSWLRINQYSYFTSGIFTGSSKLRTDNRLEVGGNGSAFYADASGDGYFSNDLTVGNDFTAQGQVSAADGFYAGDGSAGSNFGDNNILRPKSTGGWLNIKGGAGRAKMAFGNDVLRIASGSANIEFNTDASSSTNGGTRAFTIFSGGLGLAQLQGTAPSLQFVETDFGVSNDLGKIVRSGGDLNIQNEGGGITFTGLSGLDLQGSFKVRRNNIYQDIHYNGYAGVATFASDIIIGSKFNMTNNGVTVRAMNYANPTFKALAYGNDINIEQHWFYLNGAIVGRFDAGGFQVDTNTELNGTLTASGTTTFNAGVYANSFIDTPEIRLPDTSTKLLGGANNSLRVQTSHGYLNIGPQNTSYCHITTDRSKFYMNNELEVVSRIRIYNTENYLGKGILSLDSTGDAGIIINADSDNISESDNPYLLLKQDGGQVQGKLHLDGNNNLVVDLMDNAVTDLVFKANGVEIGRMNRSGVVTCADFIATG